MLKVMTGSGFRVEKDKLFNIYVRKGTRWLLAGNLWKVLSLSLTLSFFFLKSHKHLNVWWESVNTSN